MNHIKHFLDFVNEDNGSEKMLGLAKGLISDLLTGKIADDPGNDGGSKNQKKTNLIKRFGSDKKFEVDLPEGGKVYGKDSNFTYLDLNTKEGFEAYSKICDSFIAKRPPNLLGVTGDMLASGARDAFNNNLEYKGMKIGVKGRYIPPELACAQLAIEGGIGNKNPESRPIKTKNPFNIGNVDSGSDVSHEQVQSGINAYYFFMARDYLVPPKKASDLVTNFVNKSGNRYASGTDYEKKISKISTEANSVAQPVLASLKMKTSPDLA